MDVLLLLVFLSAALAAAGVGLFVWSVRQRTFDQADRLALLPLRDDAGVASPRRAHATTAPLADALRRRAAESTESAGSSEVRDLARGVKSDAR